jgi:hypothetical protein
MHEKQKAEKRNDKTACEDKLTGDVQSNERWT